MTSKNLLKDLFAALPELHEVARKVFWYYGEKPLDPYPVFSDVLRPATYAALDCDDVQAIRRYFGFYERVASDPDEAVNSLSHIELIEQLANDQSRLRLAWPYMGQSTREQARVYARETRRQFGREVWLPE